MSITATYADEREREQRDRRWWINGLLIEADCYADALRLADLIGDSENVAEAEQDSGAKLV